MRRSLAVFRLTTSSLLIALSIVLQRFFVFPAGPSVYRISLANVPIIFASLIMGPLYGGVVGALSDLTGTLLFPVGSFLPWPLISATLYGVLPFLLIEGIRRIPKVIKTILFHVVAIAVYVFVVVYIFKNNQALYWSDSSGEKYLEFSPLFKILFLTVISLLGLVLSGSITWLQIKNKDTPPNEITWRVVDLAFALLITRIILDVVFATIWKKTVMGADYAISIFFHTIILLILVPLETFILTLISKPLSNIKSRFS